MTHNLEGHVVTGNLPHVVETTQSGSPKVVTPQPVVQDDSWDFEGEDGDAPSGCKYLKFSNRYDESTLGN